MLGKNVGKFRSTKAAHVVFVLVGGRHVFVGQF